jgi:hypothetical protein
MPHDLYLSGHDEEISMKALAGQLTGILLILVGAGFVVAALGGLDPVGIQSLPQQWAFGLAGVVAGRILLVAALGRRTGAELAPGSEPVS